jgi:hypothetical protein
LGKIYSLALSYKEFGECNVELHIAYLPYLGSYELAVANGSHLGTPLSCSRIRFKK